MSLLSNTAVLLGKELRTEFRSRELLTTTAVFILVVLIMFSFAINPTAEESRAFCGWRFCSPLRGCCSHASCGNKLTTR
jgi:ABC-type transport system involved in multi-copper enzyme maturation permease subunit